MFLNELNSVQMGGHVKIVDADTNELNSVQMRGHVKIVDADTGEILREKSNAIHPQNMARIIARALSNESNSCINRIAFGNGGTVTDPTGAIIFNPTNDGRDGSWESRLYNETYSEILKAGPNFGKDLGSSESGNFRTGGGAVPEDDPVGGGVSSIEVGSASNIVISMYLNKNEPAGQLNTINDFGVQIDENERTFIFDEIGLYSPGKQPAATYGTSSVNVGNKNSQDICLLSSNADYSMAYEVDGNPYVTNLRTPAGGSGPSGAFTYGDLCEGINTGNWVTSGDAFNTVAIMFITDRTGGLTYTTIGNKESYGFLTVQSNSTGSGSNVTLTCNSGNLTDLFRALTNNVCVNVDVNKVAGSDAGTTNDQNEPANERERLLTHLVFPPITKTADKALNIIYTITVTVARTNDSRVVQLTQLIT